VRIEKQKDLTLENQISYKILKAEIFSYLGQPRDVLNNAEEAYQNSQKIGNNQLSFDALYIKMTGFYLIENIDDMHLTFDKADKIFQTLPETTSNEYYKMKLKYLLIKGLNYAFYGELENGLEYYIERLALSKKLGDKHETVISLLGCSGISQSLGDLDKALDYAMKSLEIAEKIANKPLIARNFSLISNISRLKGDLDQALDYAMQSLAYKEIQSKDKIETLLRIGEIFRIKGELNKAMKYCEQGLSFSKEIDFKYEIGHCLWRIGQIFWNQGKLENASEYLKRSLKLSEDNEFFSNILNSLFHLTRVNVDLKALDQAKMYLQRLKEFTVDSHSIWVKQLCQVGEAYILKTSNRSRSRIEAENLLNQVIKEPIMYYELTIFALIELCDLLLIELRMTNDVEVLEEIKPVITRLLKISEEQHSYRYIAETKLLQAKLALIQMDIEKAEQLLTLAQQLAEKHGLQLLAQKISHEHDKLLDQLEIWDKVKKEETPISELIKLASTDGVLERIQGKRAVESPELVDEEPILLLIMDNSGATYFNYTFMANWDHSDLFSSFMSAFNTFSDEIFSKSIDRIRIGENTILINPIESFLTCYVIKGQSYSALKKLNKFADVIKKKSEIWDSLVKSIKTSEMLDLNNPSSLGAAVKEIFFP
jgi:tetratricopeptide (TPR) repeat protein